MNVLLAENPPQTEPTDLTDVQDSSSLLAWAGWQLQMPSEWRPLKLLGTEDKGWMIVGDSLVALFSIHWQRPKRRTVRDGHEWVESRLKQQGLIADEKPPAANQFTACTWARGVQTEEDKQTTYWYGYDEYANLLLGLKVNGVLPQDERDLITEHVLPTLRATPKNQDQVWAMHDVSFATPTGFALQERHLYTGDVGLLLKKGMRESLTVRQVYPGQLALNRRPFERWLDMPPFKQHRKLRKRGRRVEDWEPLKRSKLKGIYRSGYKRLGFPLGFVRPRHTHAIIVFDESLNRLLIAEHQSASETDAKLVEQMIMKMNQCLRGGR